MLLKGIGILAPSSGATVILLFLSLLMCCGPVSPANILFHHNTATYSHRIASYPLASALADKGHNVTFITPHPLRPGTVAVNPKIVEIVPKQFEQRMKAFTARGLDINVRVKKKEQPPQRAIFFPMRLAACESLLTSAELREWVNQTTELDLIVMDSAMSECLSALSYIYDAKLVTFGAVMTFPHEYDQYGFSPESSYIPEVDLERQRAARPMGMGLVERLWNTLLSLQWRYEHYQYMSKLDFMARQHLEELKELEGMPHLDDVARNISLFLTPGDVVTDYPRAQPPLFVNVAGMHLRAGKPLPAELEDIIIGKEEGGGGSSEGFIYISFGSGLVASNLPEEIKQVFFSTMESFPKLRFLWRWGGEKPKSYPKNLHLANWYPQQDLLAHPNIKAFITQGGRPSSLEAVYHGVPLISFPVMADNDFNGNRLNEMGANVLLELGSVTREELREAILRTAYDSRIKGRMLELQKILVDQPISPLEKAVWWVEYVLRHKDTSHLRSPGFHQSWAERRLLDVWGLLFGALFVSILLLFKICASVLNLARRFTRDNKNNTSSSSSSAKGGKKD